MAKLSTQLQKPSTPDRITRTEKELGRFKRKKARQERQEREEKAKEIQEKRFKDIKSYSKYEQEYEKLSPEIKPFFKKPSKLKEETKERKVKELEKEIKKTKEKREKLREKTFESGKLKGRDPEVRAEYLREVYRPRSNELAERIRTLQKYKKQIEGGKIALSIPKIKELAESRGTKTRIREESIAGGYEQRQRRRKVEELREKGYEPMLIRRKGKEGKTEKGTIAFYSKEAGKYADVTVPLKTQEVGKLQTSELGKARTPLTYDLAGKEVSFKPQQQLYKTQKGKLVTGLAKLDKTEKEIKQEIEEKQVKAFKERQPEKIEEPEVKDIEKSSFDRAMDWIGENLSPSSYTLGIGGTASFPKLTVEKKKKGDTGQELVSKAYGKGVSVLGKGWEKIPFESVYVSSPAVTKNMFGIPKLDLGGIDFLPSVTSEGKVRGVSLGKIKGGGVKDIGGEEEKTEKEIGKIIGKEEVLKEEQKISQQKFEKEYGEAIIRGEISFKEAKKEFKESEEFKKIQERYQKRIKKRMAERGVGFSAPAFKLTGLRFAKGVVGAVPTTTKGVGATLGGGALGLKTVSSFSQALPSSLVKGGIGALTGYEFYEAFVDPETQPTERVTSAVTAGIGATVLGYSGYKYLRKPVIRTTKLPAKTKPISQRRLLGFERAKTVTPSGKVLEKTVYPKQTLSRQVMAGRKTTVTTPIRKLFGARPLYKGIPYGKGGLKGYQKAFKKLTKYGFTGKEAKGVLRYTAPRVVTREISGVNYLISGKGVKKPISLARTTVTTRQPKMKLGGGVTTRGATPTKEVTKTMRELTAVKGRKAVMREFAVGGKGYLGKGGTFYNKLTFSRPRNIMRVYKTATLGESGKVQKRLARIPLTQRKGLNLYAQKSLRTQDIAGITKGTATTYRRNLEKVLSRSRARIVKTEQPTVYLKDRLRVLYKGKQPLSKITRGITPSTARTTARTQTKTTSYLDDVIKDVKTKLGKQTGLGTTRQITTPTTQQVQQLKTLPTRSFRTTNIRQKIQTATTTKTAVSQLGLATTTATTLLPKKTTKFKADFQLKNMIKSITGTKQKTGMKQISKTINQSKMGYTRPIPEPTLTPKQPVPRTPTPKTPEIPARASFRFDLEDPLKQKVKRRRKKQEIATIGYIQDFTSRAVGLDPIKLTKSQAVKKVKQLKTGLEIRRGIKIVD